MSSVKGTGMVACLSFGLARRGGIYYNYDVKTSGTQETVTASNMTDWNMYALALIVTEDQRISYYPLLKSQGADVDISPYQPSICMSPSVTRQELYGSGTFNYTISDEDVNAQYSLIILQCREGKYSLTNDNPLAYPEIDIKVSVDMVNARPRSDGISHLSIDLVMFERVLYGEIIVYTLMLVGLICQMIYNKDGNIQIQWFFLATVLFALLAVVLSYAQLYYQNKDGVLSDKYVVAVRVFQNFTETGGLTSLLLLSLGWSTVHFRLTDKQTATALGGMVVYFIFGVSSAACIKDSDACRSLELVSYILHSLVLLGIIIALNFTITQMRATLIHSPWDPSTPYFYTRCKQFQTFRIVFVLYLLLPTAFFFVEESLYGWQETWMKQTFDEILQILVYLHVGCCFAPLKDTFIYRAFDGTYDRVERPHHD